MKRLSATTVELTDEEKEVWEACNEQLFVGVSLVDSVDRLKASHPTLTDDFWKFLKFGSIDYEERG